MWKQLDLRALVSFARNVVDATPIERELIVLSNGFFPLSAAETFGDKKARSYGLWGEMLLRWSEDFLLKLDTLASPGTKRLLGINAKKKSSPNK